MLSKEMEVQGETVAHLTAPASVAPAKGFLSTFKQLCSQQFRNMAAEAYIYAKA